MTIEQPSSLLQAAISYATRGWRIFPLKPLTKVPLLSGSWPKYATNEPWQIVEWWSKFPEANIAVVCGTTLTVVDVDRKPGKPDGWIQVAGTVDQTTPWVATPNRGWHFYYRGSTENYRSLPGVDIQQGTQYVLAPPSRIAIQGHGTNEQEIRSYAWGHPLGPLFEDGIRELPVGLLSLLRRPAQTDGEKRDQPLLLETAPEVQFHRLKAVHQTFLSTGQFSGFASRSELIHSLATRLYQLGLDDAQVLTWLWAQPLVQDTAMEHRHGDYERGISYLWESCKKVRHHRRLPPTEAFKDLHRPTEAQALFNDVQRLAPGADVRDTLQRAVTLELDPLDEDKLLNLLKELGHSKQILSRTLAEYRKVLKSHTKQIGWRHTAGEEERPLPTVENLQVLLASKNVSVRYNLMEHKVEIKNLLGDLSKEEKVNAQLTAIRSWAAQHRMPNDQIKEQLNLLAAKNEYHPFAELIDNLTWDGTPRIRRVLDTLRVDPHREHARDVLVYRWLLSIVAAVYGYGNRPPRGVLTFVGRQHVGKTTWLKYLVPGDMFLKGYILRADQRDSVVKGLRYLLAELGEVGTTFRRQDIESLKNHIGQEEDVYRLPYAHTESTWQRRTVFAASANNTDLLKDQTGNTRWWVVPVKSIDLDAMETWWGDGHGYELLQFWKEVHMLYEQGEKWDLTDEELAMLEAGNDEFRDVPAIEGALLDTYQWEEEIPKYGYRNPRTLKEVCEDIGIRGVLSPNEQYQLREALRRHTGMRMAINKRLHLASSEGERTQGPGRKGRYWYVPAKNGFKPAGEEPFKS